MSTTDTRCVAVFTARSPQRILQEGGSQAWALDAARVRTLPFLVCVQNQNNPDRDFSDASEPHGSAFLVGRISDVIPSPEDPNSGRWMIQISEYSTVQNPKNVWQGWRNPVKYGSLEDFDIDVSKLVFHSVAEIQKDLGPSPQQPTPPRADDGGTAPISISVAKRGLAAFYGVPPDAVEIVIRG
ncbi:MAG: hypothetical protein LGL72_02780 [Acidibrevibacterium sp.]|jgi:hypothetical protein|uniref:hypothetical protein n=1 Tax=Acidibrevibacterium fodinaquatile TaxID=1969806 RepID=UPI000E0CD400|nr:hypothetical protein [Acidibrevibacterium fodinaquatile]MCA7118340.1 hypothetical protein [Acidibrevibacterium fodinaquatile]